VPGDVDLHHVLSPGSSQSPAPELTVPSAVVGRTGDTVSCWPGPGCRVDRCSGWHLARLYLPSGKFLIVALGQLLDLKYEVRMLGAELGAGPFAMPPWVHPRQLHGIEREAADPGRSGRGSS
jgi:hypothetical protein